MPLEELLRTGHRIPHSNIFAATKEFQVPESDSDVDHRCLPVAAVAPVSLGRPSKIRGSPSCMGKGRLPTNAMRGSPTCMGKGRLPTNAMRGSP